jgi:hypothetical protein
VNRPPRRQPPVLIRKESGAEEPFRDRKLRTSLRRVGATAAEIAEVLESVRAELRPGISTREVYRIAHRHLRRATGPKAARYSLQRALLELGPTGFPFESFVAALFDAEGFRTRVGVRLRGRFVTHEIDVLAERRGLRALAECKLRIRSEGKVDVRTAMYVYGRAVDLDAVGRDGAEFWLCTNGRFSADAIAYGEGMGLRLLGWNHPAGEGLRERVDRAGLHPITVLTTVPARARRALLERGIVLCRELLRRPQELRRAGVPAQRVDRVLAEARALCVDGAAAGT